MKKIFAWLSLVIMLIASTLFSACDIGDLKEGLTDDGSLTALSAPTGLRISGGNLEWNPVEYASKYTVSIDGYEYYAEDNYYELSSVSDGEHTFKVKANGDGEKYKTSQFSDEITATLSDGARAETGYYSQFDDLTKNESFLGYGFDVVRSSMFADQFVQMSYPIFKNEELMKQRLLKVDSKYVDIQEVQNDTINGFMQTWNASLDVGVDWDGLLFGGSVDISTRYSGGSSTAKSKYYHAISFINQKFYIVMQSDMNTYRSIISDGFKQDLYSDMEPAELFRNYGTHFITSAVMGGRMNAYYLYTSEEKTSFHDIATSVSTTVKTIASKTDVDLDGGYRQEAKQASIQIIDSLEIMGGADLGIQSIDHAVNKYAEWEKSLNDHASLMGIKDSGSLCPIWNLIDTSLDSRNDYTWVDENGQTQTGTRSQQLQAYFYQYGLDNYNSLMKSAGLPEITQPETIRDVKINGKGPQNGFYEVYAGATNDISFTVEPDQATGYTKTFAIVGDSEYFSKSEETALGLVVLPNTPHDTTCTIVVGAGNAKEEIKVRVLRKYNVSFILNGGKINDGTQVYTDEYVYQNLLMNSRIEEPNEPTRAGYLFKGWYTDPDFSEGSEYQFGETVICEDLTLYAKWETRTNLTITFIHNVDVSGASEILTQTTVNYNTAFAQPDDPSLTGYTFKGWYENKERTVPFDFTQPLTTDTTIYVKWEIMYCTVQFVTNGGTAVAPQTVIHGSKLTMPTSTNNEYVLMGWYQDEACTVLFNFAQDCITGPTTLYAKWGEDPLTITFDCKGGEGATVQQILEGTSLGVNLPTPTRTGYTFVGWFTEETYQTQIDETTTFTVDTTLYAQWLVERYTVTLVTEKGSVGAEIIPVTFDEPYGELPEPEYEEAGYTVTFLGWFTEADVRVDEDTIVSIDKDHALTAKWKIEANEYEVTYNLNAEALKVTPSITSNGKTVIYGEAFELEDPTCNHYNFLGWYTEDGTAIVNIFGETTDVWKIAGNVTVYAHWEQAVEGRTYISTVKELQEMTDGQYLLVQDLDLNGATWSPISSFYGNIDGGNHKIYNFTISASGTGTANFGFIKQNHGTIQNLTIGDPKVAEDEYCVKYTVDYKESSEDITCYLSVGGFVGKNYGTIQECYLQGVSIYAKFADVNNNATLHIQVGGISGENHGTIVGCTVEKCYIKAHASKDVADSGDDAYGFLGGISGFNGSKVAEEDAIIKGCIVKNDKLYLEVRADGTSNNKATAWGALGGIVGEQRRIKGSDKQVITSCPEPTDVSYSLYLSEGKNTTPKPYSDSICGKDTTFTLTS